MGKRGVRRGDRANVFCVRSTVQEWFAGLIRCLQGEVISLRLGHAAALICHRYMIDYRGAATLPHPSAT